MGYGLYLIDIHRTTVFKEGFAAMTTRIIILAFSVLFLFSGCSTLEKVVKKDLPIEDMDQLEETYVGRTAWTRSLLIDLGPEGVIDRDTKIEIISLDLHWNGAVTVEGPGRRRIRHGLELERPISVQSVEEKMARLFWFNNPEYRYRMNLRKYGKKTARAIFEHQLFKGMKREAALESWGYPDEMKSIELGGDLQEQWIYRDIRQKTKKRYVYILNGAVDSWEE
jgi:hypothetical protein